MPPLLGLGLPAPLPADTEPATEPASAAASNEARCDARAAAGASSAGADLEACCEAEGMAAAAAEAGAPGGVGEDEGEGEAMLLLPSMLGRPLTLASVSGPALPLYWSKVVADAVAGGRTKPPGEESGAPADHAGCIAVTGTAAPLLPALCISAEAMPSPELIGWMPRLGRMKPRPRPLPPLPLPPALLLLVPPSSW